MAGLGDLLQRIARSLEEASAQRPGDDLRARLGYGTGDDDEDDPAEGAIWDPEVDPEAEAARTHPIGWKPKTVWSPGTARTRGRPSADSEAPETLRARSRVPPTGRRPHAPSAQRQPAISASALSERIRARLRTPDALREAFVVKEILDRPLGRRRSRNTG